MWEQWYRAASPQQRRQLLEQSRDQGLLFAHQLPVPDVQPPSGPAALLADLLAGRSVRLESVPTPPFTPLDTALDDRQTQAVVRALATPDVALIAGYPGTGKTRVVVEVLRQALNRSWRTLFVAPSPAAVDSALVRLTSSETLSILRWHDERDPVASLPPQVARLTLAGRLHGLEEQSLPAARDAVEQTRARIASLNRQLLSWTQLDSLLGDFHQLQQEQQSLAQAREALEAALTHDLAAHTDLLAADQQSERDLAALHEQQTTLEKQIAELSQEENVCVSQRCELQPLADAREGHRWWTGAFWRATIQSSNPSQRLQSLAQRCREISEQLDAAQLQLQTLNQQVNALHEQRRHRRATLLDQLRANRLAELDGRESALQQRTTQLTSLRDELARALDIPALARGDMDPVPLDERRSATHRALEQATADLQEREEWLASLTTVLPQLPRELLAQARLIVTTLASLPREPFPGPSESVEFDLIVIEEANLLNDADLLGLARRGRRLLLVAEAPPDLTIAPPPRRVDVRRSSLPTPPFTRLWRQLHPEPRRSPIRCQKLRDRLVVTLRALSPEQQQSLHREPLFDTPDIEVAFAVGPDQEPCVAEVSFPGTTSISEAKTFILRELQDLAIHANGLMPYWREHDSGWEVELSDASSQETELLLLNGVTERVAHCPQRAARGEIGWLTTSLVFDRNAGWQRDTAEHWLAERLGLRDSGRTAILSRSYRARPALARLLAQLLFAGVSQHAPVPADDLHAPVQFIAVPALARTDARRSPEPDSRWTQGGVATLTPRMRTARGGAGFECDLVELPRPEVLPPEVRTALPASGVVNYQEACVLVQTLEEILADPDFRAAAAAWQSSADATASDALPRPCVALMSLFPAQVQLLRLLVSRSPRIHNSGITIEVGTPRDLAQRECLVAFVGLTRSHVNRAVPFSEHPRDLLLALTRAAGRLFLFGDPGTMSRRSQWFGVLDHLDDLNGPLEQALVGQLLTLVPGQETMSRTSRALESSTV